jgi:hypothetical protein
MRRARACCPSRHRRRQRPARDRGRVCAAGCRRRHPSRRRDPGRAQPAPARAPLRENPRRTSPGRPCRVGRPHRERDGRAARCRRRRPRPGLEDPPQAGQGPAGCRRVRAPRRRSVARSGCPGRARHLPTTRTSERRWWCPAGATTRRRRTTSGCPRNHRAPSAGTRAASARPRSLPPVEVGQNGHLGTRRSPSSLGGSLP